MKHKTLRIISYIVLSVALLNVYSFLIIHSSRGGKRLGVLTQPLLQFSLFPKTVYSVFREVKKPERLIEVDTKFKPINKLEYDVYALNGHYASKWIISLTNLRDDSIIHEWSLEESTYKNSDRTFSHSPPFHPILLEDKSIVLKCNLTCNLYRLDSDSNIVWHNTDFQYSHATSEAKDGNIWVCSEKLIYMRGANNRAAKYWDNLLTKVDIETGETMFSKSVSQILIENGYSYLIYGMGNGVTVSGNEPLHLNDIEPVLYDGPYWKWGDLFLSFRHRSLIILYRPVSNEILKVIHGPFLNQHDVDILSDTRISLFNNNVTTFTWKGGDASGEETEEFPNEPSCSGIVIYDFEDSTFTSHMARQFQAENISTQKCGLHHILANGDVFVESYDKGILYIFNEQTILLKKYCNKPINGLVERPYWVRIYENLDFLEE
jgi:hypothetical protein